MYPWQRHQSSAMCFFVFFFYRSVWWLQVNSNAVPAGFAFLYAVLPFLRKAITEIHVCHITECVGLYRCTNALAEWSLFDLFLPRPSLRQYVITRCTSITSYQPHAQKQIWSVIARFILFIWRKVGFYNTKPHWGFCLCSCALINKCENNK